MSSNPRSSPLPRAAGPYNLALQRGDLVFTAGQVGVDPATGTVAGEDITSQTRQAILNLEAVLRSQGAELSDVVKVTAVLTDPADGAEMNRVYAEMMPEPHPVRTTFFAGLNPGRIVELDAVAVVASER